VIQDTEVYLREGEAWIGDAAALCARFGGLYVYRLEGGAMLMGIPGKGEVSVDALLMDEGKSQTATAGDNVTTLKPAPRRTD
jgi:hypothetical protein